MTTALALSSGWSLIPTPASFTHQRHNVAFGSWRRRDTALMSVVPQKDGAYNAGQISSKSTTNHAGVEGTHAHNINAVGGGRSSREISNELSLGVTLDGGPVVDFASVKDSSSRAERALAAARKAYEASSFSSSSSADGGPSVEIRNTGGGG